MRNRFSVRRQVSTRTQMLGIQKESSEHALSGAGAVAVVGESARILALAGFQTRGRKAGIFVFMTGILTSFTFLNHFFPKCKYILNIHCKIGKGLGEQRYHRKIITDRP